MTYPIEHRSSMPTRRPEWQRVLDSIALLAPGDSFIVPVADVVALEGTYTTARLGMRIHQAGRVRSVRLRVVKQPEGLRVSRHEAAPL